MTQSEKHVEYAESIGWICYGNINDTPEEKLKRRWFDNQDPARLQDTPPPMPTGVLICPTLSSRIRASKTSTNIQTMNTNQDPQTDTQRRDGSNSERRVVRPSIIEEADKAYIGKRFLGLPDTWFDGGKVRCENGHVSSRVLKSERLGRDACLACGGHVWLTFPEDRES